MPGARQRLGRPAAVTAATRVENRSSAAAMAVMESACAAVAEKASMAKVSFNFMIQSLLLNNGHPCLVLNETQGRFGQMCLFQRTDTNVRSRDRSRGVRRPITPVAARKTGR
jgi:hypothetical protein